MTLLKDSSIEYIDLLSTSLTRYTVNRAVLCACSKYIAELPAVKFADYRLGVDDKVMKVLQKDLADPMRPVELSGDFDFDMEVLKMYHGLKMEHRANYYIKELSTGQFKLCPEFIEFLIKSGSMVMAEYLCQNIESLDRNTIIEKLLQMELTKTEAATVAGHMMLAFSNGYDSPIVSNAVITLMKKYGIRLCSTYDFKKLLSTLKADTPEKRMIIMLIDAKIGTMLSEEPIVVLNEMIAKYY